MNFKEFNYCMRRKCKECPIDGQCGLLNASLHHRLMWHPFENLDKILEAKKCKKDKTSES